VNTLKSSIRSAVVRGLKDPEHAQQDIELDGSQRVHYTDGADGEYHTKSETKSA
jgi:hypothetical protein